MVETKRGRKSKVAQVSQESVEGTSEGQTSAKNAVADTLDDKPTFPSTSSSSVTESEQDAKPSVKKRGRKPRGGKIIENVQSIEEEKTIFPNVIVHFKCKLNDIRSNIVGQPIDSVGVQHCLPDCVDTASTSTKSRKQKGKLQPPSKYAHNEVQPIDSMYASGADLGFSYVTDNDSYAWTKDDAENCDNNNNCTRTYENTKDRNEGNLSEADILLKIKELELQFHNNILNGKRSACFWDTCPFDTPAFRIPKSVSKAHSNLGPYGCFCSLNCALAYLHKEDIDASTKFERRQLLFTQYADVIGDKNFVKPAPDPRYTLDKFYGNLTIQEWRSLLASDRMLLIVDKPLTPELPEIHTESTERFMSMGTMSTNEVAQYGKFKIRKAAPKQSKGAIVAERFGVATGQSSNPHVSAR